MSDADVPRLVRLASAVERDPTGEVARRARSSRSQPLFRLFAGPACAGPAHSSLPSYESSTAPASSSRAPLPPVWAEVPVELDSGRSTASGAAGDLLAPPLAAASTSDFAPPSYTTSSTMPTVSELGYVLPTDEVFVDQPIVNLPRAMPTRRNPLKKHVNDGQHVVEIQAEDVHGSRLDLSSVINHTRSVFGTLAAVGFFGAAIAFSAFYTAKPTEPSDVLAFLAWAYASYLLATLTTVVWQLALSTTFHGFQGHVFRSQAGILGAIAVSALAITGGTVLLTLALTQRTAPGVRAAGMAVITTILAAVVACTARLYYTVVQRPRSFAIDATRTSQLARRPGREHAAPDGVLELEIVQFMRGLEVYGQTLRYLVQSRTFTSAPAPEQATRLLLACKAFNLGTEIPFRDASPCAAHEVADAIQFLGLAKTWAPFVRDLEQHVGEQFWASPLTTRVTQIRLLHSALRSPYEAPTVEDVRQPEPDDYLDLAGIADDAKHLR